MTEKEKTIIQENDEKAVLQRKELERRVNVIVGKLIEKRYEAYEKLKHDVFQTSVKSDE